MNIIKILDIGCGEDKKENAIGLDIRKTSGVDIIGNAKNLPFYDEVFDKVYSSHVIEHISHTEVDKVLQEWIRVLKKGGTIEIRCPDLRMRSLFFFFKPSWDNIQDIYGGQDHEGNYHHSGFSYGLIKNLLKESGISEVKRIKDGFKGIQFLPEDLHVKGVKDQKG